MKSFITSVGNPIAFFVMFFMPGAIHDLGGNMYRITLFGVVVLVALGYLYLAVCALFRMAIKRKSRFIDYIGQISATMFRLAVVGLIAPSLLLFAVEGNVFGFLIFLPAVVLALIWIGFSLYAICKSESGADSNLVNK